MVPTVSSFFSQNHKTNCFCYLNFKTKEDLQYQNNFSSHGRVEWKKKSINIEGSLSSSSSSHRKAPQHCNNHKRNCFRLLCFSDLGKKEIRSCNSQSAQHNCRWWTWCTNTCKFSKKQVSNFEQTKKLVVWFQRKISELKARHQSCEPHFPSCL